MQGSGNRPKGLRSHLGLVTSSKPFNLLEALGPHLLPGASNPSCLLLRGAGKPGCDNVPESTAQEETLTINEQLLGHIKGWEWIAFQKERGFIVFI